MHIVQKPIDVELLSQMILGTDLSKLYIFTHNNSTTSIKTDIEGPSTYITYHVKSQWGNKSFCKKKKLRDWNAIVYGNLRYPRKLPLPINKALQADY